MRASERQAQQKRMPAELSVTNLLNNRLEASRLGLIVGALSRDSLVSLAPLRLFTLEAAPLLLTLRRAPGL